MQNVYDLAHELARSLKETDQYKDMKKLKDQVNADTSLKKMIDDFTGQNMKIQSMLMTGQKPNEDEMKNFEGMYNIVMQDPTCAAYLNAEIAFTTIVNDISKILGEAFNE